MSDPEIIAERRGCAGFITLNRPKALNALTLGMVREISAALDEFEKDDRVARVIVAGAGERAFCAGGDIKLLYEQGRAGDHAAQLAFWREEYILNRRIKRYAKPYIVLLDGIVMGGGVGLSAHGAHVVIGGRYVFAMPEVGIGFFPDVGATYALPRLPHRVGRYFALTGERAGPGDALAFGLADVFVDSARMGELGEALEGKETIEAILASFRAPPPPTGLLGEAALIARCFAGETIGDCLAALAKAAEEGSALAKAARAAMLAKSPTSEAIALRQLQVGASLSFEEAMKIEFRIVSRICRGVDFYEGVRAVIVDKDNKPRWRPAAHDQVTAESVNAYFAPLGVDELLFDEERR
ncbi:MAG TPA: enoyl-CoA hydratase/isomerase family protein [Roseiarcus sp.]|nr:enoyl-CoA hydratase/isomerase family protein [Roseiarcus sp.]